MASFKYTTAMQQLNFTASNTWSGLAHETNTTSLTDNSAAVYIMKGTIPTQSEFDAFTASSWRSGDILLGKTVATPSGTNYVIWNAAALTLQVRWGQVTATGTGTAEWFFWRGGRGSNALPSPSMAASVSLPGGGGDVSLTDLNVVAGQVYNVGNLDFSFSKKDYTY